VPAFENEPAWFIGKMGSPYPQPTGQATMTETAEVQKARLLHELSASDGIVQRGLDVSIETAPLIATVDDQVNEVAVRAQALGAKLENENVDELTFKVQVGDGEHLEPLSVMGFDIFTGDEESVIANLDGWANFNHTLLNTAPVPPIVNPEPGNPQKRPIPVEAGQPGGQRDVAALAAKGQGAVADITALPGAVFHEEDRRDAVGL
jgi:hypothetical protein